MENLAKAKEKLICFPPDSSGGLKLKAIQNSLLE